MPVFRLESVRERNYHERLRFELTCKLAGQTLLIAVSVRSEREREKSPVAILTFPVNLLARCELDVCRVVRLGSL